MKTARIVLTAAVVLPMTSCSWRIQTTS